MTASPASTHAVHHRTCSVQPQLCPNLSTANCREMMTFLWGFKLASGNWEAPPAAALLKCLCSPAASSRTLSCLHLSSISFSRAYLASVQPVVITLKAAAPRVSATQEKRLTCRLQQQAAALEDYRWRKTHLDVSKDSQFITAGKQVSNLNHTSIIEVFQLNVMVSKPRVRAVFSAQSGCSVTGHLSAEGEPSPKLCCWSVCTAQREQL